MSSLSVFDQSNIKTGRMTAFFFFPESGGVASSVALVLWDLTLLLSATQNKTRQALNLRGKRRRRFRNTWKQPTGVERMDFRSPRPFSSPWMGVGGRKPKRERNMMEKKQNSIFCCPLFLSCMSWFFFFYTCRVVTAEPWPANECVAIDILRRRNYLLRECFCQPNC